MESQPQSPEASSTWMWATLTAVVAVGLFGLILVLTVGLNA
jgi:hypothetical protein